MHILEKLTNVNTLLITVSVLIIDIEQRSKIIIFFHASGVSNFLKLNLNLLHIRQRGVVWFYINSLQRSLKFITIQQQLQNR